MLTRLRRWWRTYQNLRWFRRTYGCNPSERLAYSQPAPTCDLCGRPYDECRSVARCYMEQLARAELAGREEVRRL